MIAMPTLLVRPAEKAGIAVPADPDEHEAHKESHPHFHVFCVMQLGQPMPYAAVHWDNAKVVAGIPDDEINIVTAQQIKDRGFQIGFSTP